MADLSLRQVRKSYGSLDILHGIDLDIRSGEFIVFVGPSGCGKSTLLRTIAGLEEITSGELEIAGEVVNDVPPSKRGIAMVFQSYALYPHMTVYDNMAFGMRIARESKAEIDKRVRQAADILQLGKYLDRLPKALSGGQRQRVAIGRAIVRNPRVFLFDESLSNLDAALRVATRVESDRLVVSVEDDGPGVPPELRERIFAPLFTTRASGTGTGLGLYICRDLAEGAFGGGVVVADSARGARFEFWCPHGSAARSVPNLVPAFAPGRPA